MTKLSDTQRVILSKAAQHEATLAELPAKLPAAARNAVLRSLLTKNLLAEIPAPREFVGLGWRQDDDGAWIALRITDAGLQAIGVDPAGGEPDDDHEAHPQPTSPAEAALLPAAGQGESQAAFPSAPPSTGEDGAQAPQRPPVSQRGPIGRAAALRMAAATVLASWEAPDHDGLDDAMVGLRDALVASPRSPRPARDPAVPRQPRTGTKQEAVLALLRRDEGATIAQIIEATGWQQHTVRGFIAGLKRRGITVEVLERVRQVGPSKQGAKGSYSIYRIAAAAPTVAG